MLLAAVGFIGGGGLVGLLIGLLVLAVVLYVVKLIIDMLPLPANIKQIALLVVGVVFLLLLLQHLFGGGLGL